MRNYIINHISLIQRGTVRRKSHAAVEKHVRDEDKDPLGLGLIEKRVLIPPISPGKRKSPEFYGNTSGLKTFSSVTDLAGIKLNLSEDPFGNYTRIYYIYIRGEEVCRSRNFMNNIALPIYRSQMFSHDNQQNMVVMEEEQQHIKLQRIKDLDYYHLTI